jgi:hypothetical protein
MLGAAFDRTATATSNIHRPLKSSGTLLTSHNLVTSALLRTTDLTLTPRHAGKVPILLQKSKIDRPRKFCESRFWTRLPLQSSLRRIRGSVVGFVRNDLVPHIGPREMHQR